MPKLSSRNLGFTVIVTLRSCLLYPTYTMCVGVHHNLVGYINVMRWRILRSAMSCGLQPERGCPGCLACMHVFIQDASPNDSPNAVSWRRWASRAHFYDRRSRGCFRVHHGSKGTVCRSECLLGSSNSGRIFEIPSR